MKKIIILVLMIIGLSFGYLIEGELSRDNGNIANAWFPMVGSNSYVGDQYDVPPVEDEIPNWYLEGIKYYVWSQGWPDSTYQGFSVGCWNVINNVPTDIIWPINGQLIYNPNIGGNWITQVIEPQFNLTIGCSGKFLIGICFLYDYPNCDAFGVDNTGFGPYDWANIGDGWEHPNYGKGTARALITNAGNSNIETTTLGTIRAMYK